MSLKNWDNRNWLSSSSYIRSFNKFLLKQIDLNKDSQILDIGCGRGKIIGNLATKLKLKNKPLGIDIESHKDKDKRIIFKKIDGIKFFKKNKKKFDLILIKQTIHLLRLDEIKKLIFLSTQKLNPRGKILIFTLDTFKNEIPTFLIMKKKLNKSLERDRKILKSISKLFYKNSVKRFYFNVNISKKKYIEMIKKRYISILLNLNQSDILEGTNEINTKYKKKIKFKDKLICIILSNKL